MARAWDREKFWVPNGNRTHDLPNTGRALYPLSNENSWRARPWSVTAREDQVYGKRWGPADLLHTNSIVRLDGLMNKYTKFSSSIALVLEIRISLFIAPSWPSFPCKFARNWKVSRGCKISHVPNEQGTLHEYSISIELKSGARDLTEDILHVQEIILSQSVIMLSPWWHSSKKKEHAVHGISQKRRYFH